MKDEVIFDDLVVTMKPIIYSIIHKLNIYKNHEEYYHAGIIGLWDAYQAFNPKKGNFQTFAYYYIRGAILQELNKNRKKEDGEQFVDDYGWQVIANSYTEKNDTSQVVELYDLLEKLPSMQRQFIELHYFKGIKLKEIAKVSNISYQTAKLWHRKILGELRKQWNQEK